MQIELKNLKIAASLSEETTAYTATIYVDGQKAFDASNRGHGGCDLYRPLPGYTGPSEAEINDWLKANHPPYASEFGTLDYTLEMLVGDLITKAEAKKKLDRMLKTRIVVIGPDKAGKESVFTYPAKYKPTAANIASLSASLKTKNDPSLVVNENPSLYDRALAAIIG